MFKYIKFTKVETADTVLEFRGGDDVVKANYFDSGVVSLKGSKIDIEALVSLQPKEISCTVITKAEFKILVSDSAQLKRIRSVVKSEISKKYDIADEIAIQKRVPTDAKRIAYEAHVAKCIADGQSLKSGIGY